MAKQGNIKIGISFQADRTALKTIENDLKKISNASVKDVINPTSITDATTKLNAAKTAASQMQAALQAGFNTKLNTVDLQKFQQSLKTSGTSISQLQTSLSQINGGASVFRSMAAQVLTTNKQLRQSSQLLTKMGETLTNTIRWTIASTAINAVTGSVRKAWNFTKELDTSLNKIAIVTGKSAEEMDLFATRANKAAKALGASTKAYADASLIYYQQGLGDKEAQEKANVTTKVANVTGQSAQVVSEQLTAVWNGYKVSAQEAETYIDKLSAVAASTAADLEELSTGMSKVASAANIMGVDIDQLNAQLATIVSVTREAPESIGTALKTVYARMSDIQAGIDSETTLGEYTAQMAEMGINVLDAKGNLRDMGDVVEEIGGKWNSLNREQQVSLAQSIAGTRQYSRMMALFDNWDMYEGALKTSKSSAGTLQKQQDEYMKSVQAHLKELGASAEGLYSSLFDRESMNSMLETLTKIVDAVDNFVEAIGGGSGVLKTFGAIAFNVFNKQIANSISRAAINIKGMFNNISQESALAAITKEFSVNPGNIEGLREMLNIKQQMDKVNDLLTEDERAYGQNLLKETAELYNQKDALQKKADLIRQIAESSTGVKLDKDASKWTQTQKDDVAAEISTTLNPAYSNTKEARKSFRDALDLTLTKQTRVDEATLQEKRLDAAEKRTSAALKSAQNKRDNAYDKEHAASAQLQRSIREDDKVLDQVSAQQAEADKQLAIAEKELTAAEKAHAEALKALEAHKKENISTSQQSQQANQVYETSVKALSEQYKQLMNDEQMQIILNNSLSEEQRKQVTESQQVIASYEKGEVSAEEYVRALKQLFQALDQGEKELKEVESTLEQMPAQMEKNAEAIKNTGDKFKNFSKDFNTKNIVSGITSISGKVVNLVSAFQMLQNIGNIWNNDDLTTGEKFAQILMNIGMALPMLISGFSVLGPIIGVVKDKKAAMLAVDAADLALGKAKLGQQAFEKLARKEELTDAEKQAAINVINSMSEEVLQKEKKESAIASINKGQALDQETLSLGTNTAANGVNAASENLTQAKGAAGSKGFMGGIKTMGKGIGKGLGAIGNAGGGSLTGGAAIGAGAAVLASVAVAAVAVGVAVNYAVKKANEEKDAMEAAKEQTQKHAQAVAELESNYSNLTQSVDKYKDLQNELSGLTEGTDEYNAALKENNKQVMELIKKYPELAAQVKNVNGKLELDPDVLEQVQDKEENKLEKERALSYAAETRSLEAENTYLKSEAASDYLWDSGDTAATVLAGVGGGIVGGAALGFGVGVPLVAAGPLGAVATAIITASAAVVGATAGIYTGIATAEHMSEQSEKVMDAFAAAYEKDSTILSNKDALTTALQAEGITDPAVLEEYTTKLMENTSAMEELGAEIAANTKAAQLQRDQAASEYLKSMDNVAYASTKYQKQVDRLMANEKLVYEDRYAEIYEDMDDSDVHEEYAKMMGYTYEDNGNGEGVFKKRNADGTTEEVKVDDEYMRQTLADNAAYKAAGTKVEEFVKQMEAYTGVLGEGLENAEMELASLAVGLEVDFSKMTRAEIEAFDKYAKENLGDKYTANIQRENTKANEAITNATQYLNEKELTSYKAIFGNDKAASQALTKESAEYLANLYDKGTASSEQVFNNFFSTLSGKNAGVAGSLLSQIDWSAVDAEEQFIKLMKEHGISVDTTAESTKAFIDEMKWMSTVQETSMSALAEKASSLQDVIEAANKRGAEISQEQYATLNSELQNFFVRTMEGTYKLIDTANEFKKAATEAYQETIKKSLEQQLEEYRDAKTKYNAAMNKDKSSFGSKTTKNEDAVAVADRNRRTFGQGRLGGAGYEVTASEAKRIEEDGEDYWLEFDRGSNQEAAQNLLYSWLLETEEGKEVGKTILDNYGSDKTKGLSYEARINALTQEDWDDITEFTSGSSFSIDTGSSTKWSMSKSAMAQDVLAARENDPKYNVKATSTTTYDPTIVKDWITELENAGILTSADANNFRDNVNQNAFMTQGKGDIIDKIKEKMKDTGNTEGIKNLSTQYLSSAKSEAEVMDLIAELEKDDGMFDVDAILDSVEWEQMKKNAIALAKQTEIDLAIEAYEAQVQAIEKVNAEYEHMNSLLEHQRTLIELSGGEKAFAKLGEFYEDQISNVENQLKNSQKSAQYWQQEMEAALAKGQTEVFEAAKANWEEATNQYYENMSQKITLLKEQYINSINEVFDEQEKLWSEGVSLDYISEEWDMMQKRGELTLDPVNAAFEKQRVENQFSTAVNEAQSLNAQKKLRDLMESEMSILEDKDELTEYDLKRAEARLEVTKAQIALEEAQANKSKMRLMRGADGSYSYQYVADVDAVTKAQDALNKAQQDLYNLDTDQYKENLNTLLEYYQEYKEKMISINEQYAGEEREAQLALLKEQYTGENGLINTLLGNNASIKDNLTTSFGDSMALLGEDFGSLGNAVDATTSKLATFVENMNLDKLETEIQKVEGGWENIETATESWNTSLENSKALVEQIASSMADATWSAAEKSGGLLSEYDGEKIGDAVVKKLTTLQGVWINETKDENGEIVTPGHFTWQTVASAATGMYTGEWGNEGKLAVLHEKELVLNKNDTANILRAVDLVRNIENALSSSMLSSILAQTSGLSNFSSSNTSSLEQNVHITAEFPNVDSKAEIEAAFEEIINLATQKAFESKR